MLDGMRAIVVVGNLGTVERCFLHFRLVFLFHFAAFGRDLVTPHGTEFVHGAIDGVGIVTILGAEFVFEKLGHYAT
jgi:hypothetical protein